eukprot:6187965-Pleurochrysis_carterae.AAC.6
MHVCAIITVSQSQAAGSTLCLLFSPECSTGDYFHLGDIGHVQIRLHRLDLSAGEARSATSFTEFQHRPQHLRSLLDGE